MRRRENSPSSSELCKTSSCRPLGRKIGNASRHREEARRERGDMSSAETSSAEGRYGGNGLIDPWTKHGSLQKHSAQNISAERRPGNSKGV